MALAVLACVPRRWATWVARGALVACALVCVQTAMQIAGAREMIGEPGLRMALILGGVALFTLASTLVFWSRRLRLRAVGGPRG
jgi:hypothetical protein